MVRKPIAIFALISLLALGGYFYLIMYSPFSETQIKCWTRQVLAAFGDSDAQFKLGEMYYDGRCSQKDPQKGVDLLRKAAEAGSVGAQSKLGAILHTGFGVATNYEEAAKWMLKAAEQGNVDAQQNIGIAYYYGRGVPKDYKEMIKWYKLAAEKGSVIAQEGLGYAYLEGWGGEQKNIPESLKWFTKVADQGNVKAMGFVASFYEGAHGHPKNTEEAMKWRRKAAERGDAHSQVIIGYAHLMGQGLPKDDDEALKWFRKALAQGNTQAKEYIDWMAHNARVNIMNSMADEAVQIYNRVQHQLLIPSKANAEYRTKATGMLMGCLRACLLPGTVISSRVKKEDCEATCLCVANGEIGGLGDELTYDRPSMQADQKARAAVKACFGMGY